MTLPHVAVVLRYQGPGLALLDRALFALAGQRHAPLHVVLSDQADPAQAPARKALLALHSELGGFFSTHVFDDSAATDPALAALAKTQARRVLFLDQRTWLHPFHLTALGKALDETPLAPFALARGRLALAARGPPGAPPYILQKRELWPAGVRFLPLDPLIPAASALLDLDRLQLAPEDLSHVSLPGLSFLTHRLGAPRLFPRATHDALRVLDLLFARRPALASGGPSFDLLCNSLPLRYRAREVLQSALERARIPLKSGLGPLARALRRSGHSRQARRTGLLHEESACTSSSPEEPASSAPTRPATCSPAPTTSRSSTT